MPCPTSLLPELYNGMSVQLDIERLYREGVEFAVYRFPGEDMVRVCSDGESLEINRWNTPCACNISVRPGRKVLGSLEPWRDSTSKESYLESTQALIDTLKTRGGKCVRMRTICGSCKSLDINAVVHDLFARFADAFCYCVFTAETGLWIGATPEVLVDIADGQLRTMSLAGTRLAGEDAEWDRKNVDEQQFVTSFICGELMLQGLVPECGRTRTLRYGAIEHICTDIVAACSCGTNLSGLLEGLSPTPAVCGQPREVALKEISQVEDAPRRCYAGYLLHKDRDGRVRAYVNLRCAHISPSGWCIYAGGGITADSDALAEWHETEAKASALLRIFNEHSL